MIRNLKSLAARAAVLLVLAAGLGFGILVAAMAAVLGGLMLISARLQQTTDATPAGPVEAAPARPDAAAQPA